MKQMFIIGIALVVLCILCKRTTVSNVNCLMFYIIKIIKIESSRSLCPPRFYSPKINIREGASIGAVKN